MHNPKGGDWGSTKKNLTRKKRRKKRKNPLRKQNSLKSWEETYPRSKRQKGFAQQSREKLSMQAASLPISNKNSTTISTIHAPPWKNLPRPIRPRNWNVKPTTC